MRGVVALWTGSYGPLNDRTMVESESIPEKMSARILSNVILNCNTDRQMNNAACSKHSSYKGHSIIAQFLGGSNSYETLSSLSLASKAVQSEVTPILYETVILDSDRVWWRVKRSSEDRKWFNNSHSNEICVTQSASISSP